MYCVLQDVGLLCLLTPYHLHVIHQLIINPT